MTKTRNIQILWLFVLAWCAFSFAVLGCGFKEPEVKLKKAKVKAVSVNKMKMIFTVSVDNPNKMDLRVKRVDVIVKLFGKKVVGEKIDRAILIAKNEKTSFEVPVTIRFKDFIDPAINTLTKQHIEYWALITIKLDTPAGAIKIPVEKTGAIRIKDIKSFLKGKRSSVTIDIPVDLGAIEING